MTQVFDTRGQQLNIRFRRGSDIVFTLQLYTQEGFGDKVPVNLTGQTVTARFWVDNGAAQDITSDIVVPATLGQIELTITAAQTALVDDGSYTEYSVFTTDGGIKKDRLWGELECEGPVL